MENSAPIYRSPSIKPWALNMMIYRNNDFLRKDLVNSLNGLRFRNVNSDQAFTKFFSIPVLVFGICV